MESNSNLSTNIAKAMLYLTHMSSVANRVYSLPEISKSEHVGEYRKHFDEIVYKLGLSFGSLDAIREHVGVELPDAVKPHIHRLNEKINTNPYYDFRRPFSSYVMTKAKSGDKIPEQMPIKEFASEIIGLGQIPLVVELGMIDGHYSIIQPPESPQIQGMCKQYNKSYEGFLNSMEVVFEAMSPSFTGGYYRIPIMGDNLTEDSRKSIIDFIRRNMLSVQPAKTGSPLKLADRLK